MYSSAVQIIYYICDDINDQTHSYKERSFVTLRMNIVNIVLISCNLVLISGLIFRIMFKIQTVFEYNKQDANYSYEYH